MTERFPLGMLCITPNAAEAVDQAEIGRALARHSRGDWGDVVPDDWFENDQAVDAGLRLLSVYHAGDGRKFWVITEADRSATTVLLPEDY